MIRILIDDEHVPSEQVRDVLALPDHLQHAFHQINRKLDRLLGQEQQEQVDIAALAQQVTDSTELDKSIKLLVEGIAGKIENSSDPAMAALAAKLKESGDALATAVQASTQS